MELTVKDVKDLYPEVYESIRKEGFEAGSAEGTTKGKEEGVKSGAEAERKRIQDVEAQCIPGHEKLIAELKYDGKTTGPEAAVKVLAAEKEARTGYLKNMKEGAPKIVDQPAAGAGEPLPAEGDFEVEVTKYQEEHKCKRSEAIIAVTKEKPELHQKWLEKVNKK
jgi:hypothetical protein